MRVKGLKSVTAEDYKIDNRAIRQDRLRRVTIAFTLFCKQKYFAAFLLSSIEWSLVGLRARL